MAINDFFVELNSSLSLLDFIEGIQIEEISNTSIKIKIKLRPKGILSVWYNAVSRTQSFSIILENKRKWGFDFDNRIGWHEHPLENPELHVSAQSKTIAEIVARLKHVWGQVSY